MGEGVRLAEEEAQRFANFVANVEIYDEAVSSGGFVGGLATVCLDAHHSNWLADLPASETQSHMHGSFRAQQLKLHA